MPRRFAILLLGFLGYTLFGVGAWPAAARQTPSNPPRPTITFSTLVCGRGATVCRSVALDRDGDVWVFGDMEQLFLSSTTGTLPNGGRDLFLAKLSRDGQKLLFLTYIGGGRDETAGGFALDGDGNLYLTGATLSPDFPVTNWAAQPRIGGPSGDGNPDAFVLKLSPEGKILYSTYLGGERADTGRGIAVDAAGAVRIVGTTDSLNLPTTAGAFQAALGGRTDAFIAKLNPDGTKFDFCTYLGGVEPDGANAVALDADGNAYLVGQTDTATIFPLPVSYVAIFGGETDALVARFDPSGTLTGTRYLGGPQFDEATCVVVDREGFPVIAGETRSWNFPGTAPAPNTRRNAEAFVVRLDSETFEVTAAMLHGGIRDERARGIALFPDGTIGLVGETSSHDFPTVNAPALTSRDAGWDAFAARLDLATRTPLFSGRIGGSNDETGTGITVDDSGAMVVAGATASTNFLTVNALQPVLMRGSGAPGFVVALRNGPPRE